MSWSPSISLYLSSPCVAPEMKNSRSAWGIISTNLGRPNALHRVTRSSDGNRYTTW